MASSVSGVLDARLQPSLVPQRAIDREMIDELSAAWDAHADTMQSR
jgi:hypothetical protein